jgi:predicted RecB family nuclease
LSGVKVGYLPGLIDQARAAVSGRVFRARGLERIQVPRADVEVDVDMENCDASVYLWGTWSCGPDGMPGGYQPFVDWTPLDGNVEAQLFARFWAWLMQLRDSTVGSGDTFAAYCYSSAENTQMRRIAAGSEVGPSLDEVDCFIASPEWVDLLTVMRGQLVTGGSLGLKQVAPLAGFHWRDEDPGGDQSMVWYERAVNNSEAEVRGENRARLLAYNEDDVKATEAVREWLEGSDFEPITEWTV